MAINQNNVAFAQEAIEKILYTNGAIVGGATTLQKGIQNGDAVSATIAGADTINAAIKLFKSLNPFVDVATSGAASYTIYKN